MPDTSFLVVTHLHIAPGKSGLFSKGAQSLAELVEGMEHGPRRWEVFLAEDHLHGYLVGYYSSSEEWLRVASHTVPLMQSLLEVASYADMVVFGAPSGKARQLLARFAPRFCSSVAGFRPAFAEPGPA